MNMNGKRGNRLWILLTAILVLVATISFSEAVVGWSFPGLVASVTLGVIIATMSGGLWIFRNKMQEKRKGIPLKDERTEFINGLAARYTFFASLYFVVGLLWYNVFFVAMFGLPELDTTLVLIVICVVMISVFMILRNYFSKKEDIQ